MKDYISLWLYVLLDKNNVINNVINNGINNVIIFWISDSLFLTRNSKHASSTVVVTKADKSFSFTIPFIPLFDF